MAAMGLGAGKEPRGAAAVTAAAAAMRRGAPSISPAAASLFAPDRFRTTSLPVAVAVPEAPAGMSAAMASRDVVAQGAVEGMLALAKAAVPAALAATTP